MKKLIIILLVILVFVGGFLYFQNKKINVRQKEINFIVNNKTQQPIEKSSDTKEIHIGNMIINYPNDIEVSNPVSLNSYVFNLSGINFLLENFPKRELTTAKINILVNKNENAEKLDVKNWWQNNSFETDKQSPSSYLQEEINIKNIKVLKTYFKIQNGFGFKNYETIITYIAHGTDIYEIQSYQLPENPDPSLTPEDIKNMKDYEKIVDQIIQSIRFVE